MFTRVRCITSYAGVHQKDLEEKFTAFAVPGFGVYFFFSFFLLTKNLDPNEISYSIGSFS